LGDGGIGKNSKFANFIGKGKFSAEVKERV
jgi:hypothetical protein